MKKRRRSKSRKSAGSASPSGSGEPASPCRSGESASPVRTGETAASPARYGEWSTSASAGEGGDEMMRHRRSESGDSSLPSGEGTDLRAKQFLRRHQLLKEKDKRFLKEIKEKDKPFLKEKEKQLPFLKKILKEYEKGLPMPMSSGDGLTMPMSSNDDMPKHVQEEWSIYNYKEKERRQREAKQRKKEKQGSSAPCVQHDALIIEESSLVSEQQHHKTSSLSPNPSPTIVGDRFADLQDAGEVALPVQHDALVTKESSMVLEQQQHKTSSLSPSPLLTSKGDAAEEDSAVALSRKIKGNGVVDKAWQTPSDSTQKSNVGGVPGHVLEATRTYASPPSEEESSKVNDDVILKKGCANDDELQDNQSDLRASHSSSRSGDAQEEAPFDGDETSWLKVDKKQTPSISGDCAKIAQNIHKDGHSGKNVSSVVEDEKNSDKVGVNAIEDHRRRARKYVQALLDIDDDTAKKEFSYWFRQLNFKGPKDPFYWSICEPQQLVELYQRLALYRIRGYELYVDSKLDNLDDANLAQHYPPHILYDEGYFEHYEEYLEWYFDPELCNYSGFDDYQRLVLRNDGYYQDWDYYQSTFHTYEKDQAYVQYWEAIENKTKWIEDYHVDTSIPEVPWERVKTVANIQALKIATGLPNVSPRLVLYGFAELMQSIGFDLSNYVELDAVYFEIWKRVAKQKMDFREALSQVYQENRFPARSFDIKSELEEDPLRKWSMKDKYDDYVACIGDVVSDDEALALIANAVKEMCPKTKYYVDYARKKMEIAKEIGLIKEGATEVTGHGDSGEAEN